MSTYCPSIEQLHREAKRSSDRIAAIDVPVSGSEVVEIA
jgi:hypothetical protein